MSVYSNTEIKAAIADGTIVSVPFNASNVSEASLDFNIPTYQRYITRLIKTTLAAILVAR